MTRYLPSKQYGYAGVAAMVMALFCAVLAIEWPLCWITCGLLVAAGGAMLVLAFLPAIEVHETHLAIGGRMIRWSDIVRLDRTGFVSPLVVNLTLTGGQRVVLVYPGGLELANALLRHLRRMCRDALIDGIPYRQFWGEALSAAAEGNSLPSPKYQLLRPEDEADVERLFHRLKTVGHLDRAEE